MERYGKAGKRGDEMTDEVKYVYRGRNIRGVDPEDAFHELERIREARGLTAEAVVEESRPKEATLHSAFEWNDRKAAHEHRLQQARQVIRCVQVVMPDQQPASVYVHVQQPTEGAAADSRAGRYEPVEVVVQSPDLFALALSELQAKVRAAVESVHELERAAKGSTDADRLAKVTLAVKALETAASAISSLH